MGKYDRVSFIKLSNNNNAARDFTIDVTTMKDCRLRISALRSQYKTYLQTKCGWLEVFRYFELDYSFYCLETEAFDSYDDVKKRKNELLVGEWNRMNPNNQRNFEEYFDWFTNFNLH